MHDDVLASIRQHSDEDLAAALRVYSKRAALPANAPWPTADIDVLVGIVRRTKKRLEQDR